MSFALGFIEIQHTAGQPGAIHPALTWPDRIALSLDAVLSQDDPHVLAKLVKQNEDVTMYYCNRDEPGVVYCGKLAKAGRRKGFKLRHQCLVTEHPSFQATPTAVDVFGAIVQTATKQFEQWQSLGSEVIDELDGKTWAGTPRAFIDASSKDEN